MLPSWLSKRSSNPQAPSQPLADDISKDSHSTAEQTGHSSQSAIHITDNDHNDVHEYIYDPSTYSAPIEQDALKPDPSTSTSGDVKSLGHSTEPARFLTPHDDILTELQGYLPSGAHPEQQSSLRTDAPLGSSLNLGSSAVENSLFTSESLPLPSHEPAKEIMYEPSTGQRLHDYVPTPVRSGADDALWSHLSHILELQSEIAKMHVDMENVRTARGRDGPAVPERGAKADTTRNETGKDRRRSETLGEEEDDDESDEVTEGEEEDDHDEGFGKRNREGEFTRLAERFAERNGSIDAVMNKLDNLSSALKTFHALPTPVIDFASSRTNTTSLNAPLTTDRGTGAAVPTTSAPARLSVKPLAKTIIDDCQHVDSPVDMHPTQSIIDRNVGKK